MITDFPSPLQPMDLYGTFQHQAGLGKDITIALLVKYQKDRQALIRHRQTFQQAQQTGRFAPLLVPLRQETWGGGFAAILPLRQGFDLSTARWCLTGQEVRGLAWHQDLTLVALANELRLVSSRDGQLVQVWQQDRFRNLHSVAFHPREPHRVLLANAGLDEILEFSLATGQVVWSWMAWQHGYHRNPAGIGLIRQGQPLPDGEGHRLVSQQQARELLQQGASPPGEETWWVAVDLAQVSHPLGLEKWLKGAEPNWAGYDPHGNILATFFVANQAVRVSRQDGRTQVVRERLGRPHGLVPWAGGAIISDTRRGQVLLLDHDLRPLADYDFTTMPLPASFAVADGEWLQFTNPLSDRLLVTVDARRAILVVWDPANRLYEIYPFNRDWEVHAVLAFADG